MTVLIVSQDYELFFQRSGSIEKCLFEPTDMLLEFAELSGIRISFFVDAGMLCRMQQLSSSNPSMDKDLSRIKRHIETIHSRGHEIGLHVHPHWEDTRWSGEQWDFSNTRYQLRDFSPQQIRDIVSRYTAALHELCDGEVTAYRAGGFCVEPFDVLGEALLENGISVDSSVVPGARLKDPDKGFDFSGVTEQSWWRFDESPTQPCEEGRFLEVPVTPVVLPFLHYWGRAFDRALGRQPSSVIGDGVSKAIGKREIVRRLAGGGRVSELSVDIAKVRQLLVDRVRRQRRDVWQVMGHPKLLGPPSLDVLQSFIEHKKIKRFESISGFAGAVRAGELSAHPD